MHTNGDHFHREIELESHWSYPWQHCNHFGMEGGFWEPCMAASLLGLSKERRKGRHQGTTMDELAKMDLAED